MNFEIISGPILQKLLFQIARYAGFSSCTGLFDGKIGSVILLYNGARFLKSRELEQVANSIIDDIIEEPAQNELDFCNGLSGIAWGLHYLKTNKFIELDINYFDELDGLLFEENALIIKKNIFQYPFWGLYIQARLSDSTDHMFLQEQAMDYINHMLLQLYVYTETPDLLVPFLYCVWQWHNEKTLSDDIITEVCQKLSFLNEQSAKTYKSAVSIQLYHKLCCKEHLPFSEELTFTDIKTIFFYKLLFNRLTLPSWDLINKSFMKLLADPSLKDELLILCNHKNQGLTQNISGFTWSLLQYIEHTSSTLRMEKYNHNNY